MKNKIVIVALIIFIFFLAVYGLTYHQWQNKKTVITTVDFYDNSTEITLKRNEVAPYFSKLKQKTRQDALKNIPYQRFNFCREISNTFKIYWAALTYNENIFRLSGINADSYFIDPFGIAVYRFFPPVNDDYYDSVRQTLIDPVELKMYENIFKRGFTPSNEIYISFAPQSSIPRHTLNYPIITDQKEGKSYINIHYLHNNEIFSGKYWGISITTADRELFIDKDKAALTYRYNKEKKKTGDYTDLPYNKIVAEYKVVDIDGLLYIDIFAINGLYDYKVINNFSPVWWGEIADEYSPYYLDNDSYDGPAAVFGLIKSHTWWEKNMAGYFKHANVIVTDPEKEGVSK